MQKVDKVSIFDKGFYNEKELRKLGFAGVGDNVRVSKNCTIVGVWNIKIGSNVRIDDYCTILSLRGNVVIGSYVHIGGYTYIGGNGGVVISDYSGVSQRVTLYSASDRYTGECLTNPTVPEELTKLDVGPVVLKKHVIIGSGSVVLPNVVIGEGVAVGALSLVKENLEEWSIYAGVPVRKIKERLKTAKYLEGIVQRLKNTPSPRLDKLL